MKLDLVTYSAIVGGAFFGFLTATFFCCFLGLPESKSNVVDAPAAKAPAPARLRDLLSWHVGLAGSEGSG